LVEKTDRLAELRPAVGWLVDHRPTEANDRAIGHGDFQPFNILVADGKVTAVLDWVNAAVGDPAMDVGASAASFVTVPLSIPAPFRLAGYARMRVARRAYLKAYTRLNPIPPEKLRYYEVMRCVGELGWLAEGTVRRDVRLGAYQSAQGVRRLTAYLRRLTELDVRLPFTF
jgi:aminoglycoside phosphotransferase (APT) family kinase protein